MRNVGNLKKRTTLKAQLRTLSMVIGIPFVAMTVTILVMVYLFNREYTITLRNATTASAFNMDFKEKLDLDMYYYVIGNSSMAHLPLEEVENAKGVIQKLQETTTISENQWRVKSLLRLCSRLSECMLHIQETKSYDKRMEQLEQDVYVLTKLIEDYVQDYIYCEVKALSALQDDIQYRVKLTIGLTSVISMLLLLIMCWYCRVISKNITKPVYELCEKVAHLGKGDFNVVPIQAKNQELLTLDEGFNEMTVQMNRLLQRVKDNQNELRKAELELLQAQINPHFLYNTLDSIIWLAESHQDAEVIRMTSNLSTFFRTSLSSGKDIITLATERQQIESYLKIQKIRYSDILQYTIDISPELYHFLIPKLTLQPLVENALYHGVKNKREIGYIQVIGREEGDDILLQVIDNGAGMDEVKIEELRGGFYEENQTGLGNVQNRLRLYCGAGYGLSFDSEVGVGTTVTVRLPKKMDEWTESGKIGSCENG